MLCGRSRLMSLFRVSIKVAIAVKMAEMNELYIYRKENTKIFVWITMKYLRQQKNFIRVCAYFDGKIKKNENKNVNTNQFITF